MQSASGPKKPKPSLHIPIRVGLFDADSGAPIDVCQSVNSKPGSPAVDTRASSCYDVCDSLQLFIRARMGGSRGKSSGNLATF
jgi:hypothetical protein